MFQIEFFGTSNGGSEPEVLDRMRTDMTELPHLISHAKSLFANAVAQRVHKPLPHGFRILDGQGNEVARWSLDESGSVKP